MRTKVQEQEILREALKAFQKTTGLTIDRYPVLEPVVLNGETPDAGIARTSTLIPCLLFRSVTEKSFLF